MHLADFEKQFRVARQRAAEGLSYGNGPAPVRAALARIDTELQAMQPLVAPALPQLRLPPDSETRFRALHASVMVFSNEVARWDQIMSVWKQPGSLEAYLGSLKSFQQSEFALPAEKAPAGEVLGLNITDSSLMAGLLLPGDPDGWAEFTRQPELSLRAVRALCAQTLPLTIVVVDNGSGDGSDEQLAAHADVEGFELVRSSVNGGFGAGC